MNVQSSRLQITVVLPPTTNHMYVASRELRRNPRANDPDTRRVRDDVKHVLNSETRHARRPTADRKLVENNPAKSHQPSDMSHNTAHYARSSLTASLLRPTARRAIVQSHDIIGSGASQFSVIRSLSSAVLLQRPFCVTRQSQA